MPRMIDADKLIEEIRDMQQSAERRYEEAKVAYPSVSQALYGESMALHSIMIAIEKSTVGDKDEA